MRRRLRALTGCVMLLTAASVATGPSANAIPASKCTHVIQISGLAFGPGTVVPGGTSTIRLTGMNCTKHAQSVTVTWLGHFAGTAITGCPVIDPLAQPVSVAARANLKAHLSFTVPKGCTAKSLAVTARITGGGGAAISHKTASLRIAQKPMSGS